jgi:hypothetical protein
MVTTVIDEKTLKGIKRSKDCALSLVQEAECRLVQRLCLRTLSSSWEGISHLREGEECRKEVEIFKFVNGPLNGLTTLVCRRHGTVHYAETEARR